MHFIYLPYPKLIAYVDFSVILCEAVALRGHILYSS